jgi:hypothetical protein
LSLIVGLHLGAYALIAADTRLSYYVNDVFGYRDDSEKIQVIEPGIISGAGLASLVDNVKKRLDDDELGVIDRISDLVRGEVAYTNQQPWATERRVADAIGHTAWMFTFVGVPPGLQLSDAVLRLALTVPDKNYALAHVAPNDAWLFPPTDTTEEQFWTWKRRMKDGIEPLLRAEDFQANLSRHVDLVGQLMADVSAVNKGVAPTFQVGVHVLALPRLVSTIMRHGDPIKWDTIDDEPSQE